MSSGEAPASKTPVLVQTALGPLPEDWAVEILSAVSERIMVGIASAATHAYRTKGIPLLRNQNIKHGYLDDIDLLFVDAAYERTFRNKRLQAGDLITARTGYPGVTCIVPPAYESAQSFTTLITRIIRDQVDSSFLCHFINSDRGQSFFHKSQIGGAQKNVNAGTLRKMPVPVPPLPEQRAIASALSDVDALLVALDRLIAKKRDLKRAAMQQLLTGRTRLSGFGDQERWGGQATRGRAPDSWRASTIGEFAHLSSGTTPPRSLADRYYRGGIIPWVKTLDLNNALISHTDERVTPLAMKETSLRVYPPGTVLVAMYGGFNQIGRTGLLQISAAVNQAITAIQLKNSEVCPEFLLAVLNLRVGYWKTIASSSRKDPNIASQDIRRFPLAYPEIAEQTAIAAVLSDMDAEITALEQRRDKTRLLKQGMMQELLTGRIRLV